ncbi:MAG: CYTH domain-containing protein [Bacteroidales bacterium]|nr:CYTH domain-containing protein [Bacteroidales bacterium]
MEIERKYLVDRLPENLDQYPHTEIEQGYLCTSPTVRIRKAGDVFWLTVKEKAAVQSTAIHNREEEFRLTEENYNRLKSKCDGQMVRKTRYRIPIGTLTAELDIFHMQHEGLRLVEVEFPSTAVADAFVPPDWFGPDVSSDRRFTNSFLAFIDSI